MKRISLIAVFIAMTALSSIMAEAQTAPMVLKKVNGEWVPVDSVEFRKKTDIPLDPQMAVYPKTCSACDSLMNLADSISISDNLLLPDYYMIPAIFDFYRGDYANLGPSVSTLTDDDDEPYAWINERLSTASRFRSMKQNYMIENPQDVQYNTKWLLKAPKPVFGKLDASSVRLKIKSEPIDKKQLQKEVAPVDIKRKYWIHSLDAQVQFSQAYISPNWYQGGNNNLNFILNAGWDVKLNTNYHPTLMFENSIRYKLALNSAPEDSLRHYSISEDLFQINTRFGVKAHKHWYYSATLQFKTQFLNNYKPNTNDLMASFLSSSELNFGLGMTYNYQNAKNTLTIAAAISPASYNLKTCINDRVDPTAFGIRPGHKTVNEVGSSVDGTLTWIIAHNIKLLSHLTAFTNYDYLQANWENTVSFTINRFLSTQIYVNMRYDTQTPRVEGSKWSKFQLKEILSFGFAYKFGTAS